ncbi:MAG: hypothetical protein WDZ35_15530 [Crocinitomicaceae bacterium]
MKSKIILLTFFAFTALSLTYKTQDDCKTYFPIQEGMEWTYNEYNKKDKLTGTNTVSVENVAPGKDGLIEYQMKGVIDGPKGKEKNHHEQSFKYICDDGKLKMSMETMIPKEQMEAMQDMELQIDQKEIMIPKNLKAGDQLEDASINMKVSASGIQVMNMTVYITNRKVEKFETITTEAGSFDCAVISYDSEFKMGFMDRKSSGKDWFSPEAGNVRSEFYDKDGILESYRVLTAYSNGK